MSSGTDALLLALMALDVGAGDEVITTPFTFFATAGVVARLGARPFFCDIDPAHVQSRPAAVRAAIAERCELRGDRLVNRATGGVIKALLPVHLYGQMADLDAFMALARKYRLAVVEDAAQAIGAALADGRRAGSVGDVGCLSFFPTKNLGAFGDAGMCVSNDSALHERMRILRVHGGEPKYYHSLIGGNFRLDELQAAVLVIKLKHLDDWTRARQANADHYDALFRAADLGERGAGAGARAGLPAHLQPVRDSHARSATSCARISPPKASARRSTIPCRCTLSAASPISSTSRDDFPESQRAAARGPGAADLSRAQGRAARVRGAADRRLLPCGASVDGNRVRSFL